MKQLLLLLLGLLFFFPSNGQWSVEHLSEARSQIASFDYNGKVFFVGGEDDFAGNDVVDIYDIIEDEWSTAEVPVNALGWDVVDAGDFVVFVNGLSTVVGRMMIYDKLNGSWSNMDEIDSRYGEGLAGMSNKIYFAGGKKSSTGVQKTVNILDLMTNEWTIDSLSVARQDPDVAYYGDRIFFVGGAISPSGGQYTNVVDVLNTTDNTWESFNLTESKYKIGVEIIDDKMILAGGQTSNNLISGFTDMIEVVDLNDYSITTHIMSGINYKMKSVVLNEKAIFIGGKNGVAEIFNPSDNTLVTYDFGVSGTGAVGAATLGKRAFFTEVKPSDRSIVNIYDSELDEWSTYDMILDSRDVTMVSHLSKLFIAGGMSSGEHTDEVHIFWDETISIDLDEDGYPSEEDCDDNNSAINPGAEEIPYNGVDDDCDALTLDDDLDQDGYSLEEDCDDNNSGINPGVEEVPYNELDDDCDALTLDDDLDQDGYLNADDCDDSDSTIYPEAIEIPNNDIDEDCDGSDLIVGTFELSEVEIKMSPNPAANRLRIDVRGELNFGVRLFDLRGKVLIDVANVSIIDLSTISGGTYLLELTDFDSNQKIVEKLIVIK